LGKIQNKIYELLKLEMLLEVEKNSKDFPYSTNSDLLNQINSKIEEIKKKIEKYLGDVDIDEDLEKSICNESIMFEENMIKSPELANEWLLIYKK
jgi:hypothetical protein